MKTEKEQAQKNLLELKANSYPGRGIIVGLSENGQYLVQVYFVMGRSVNSQNRVFIIGDERTLETAPADPAKVKDPRLIIYTAMAETANKYAVSNGAQTYDALSVLGLEHAMQNWQYEPDPSSTPRISAVVSPQEGPEQLAEISILKKSPTSDECDRLFYKLPLTTPGLGYCITTYSGDGEPLPAFKGNPYLLPLEGSINKVRKTIWESLTPENKVCLAVKFIALNNKEVLLKTVNKYNVIKSAEVRA